jgi:arylformamidase
VTVKGSDQGSAGDLAGGYALLSETAPPLDQLKDLSERAEAVRAAHPPSQLRYGAGPREVIDLFSAGQEAPVAVFLHGPGWSSDDASPYAAFAPALLSHGVSLAIPSRDSAPALRLGRILTQARDAMEAIRDLHPKRKRPLVFGHGAGGHMAACMLSEGRANAAVSLSGVFDLTPLLAARANDALNLDTREAAALSPIHWPVPDGSTPGGTVFDAFVSADDAPEIIAQSRLMTALWAARGVETRFETLAAPVLTPLLDADSILIRRLVELAKG